MDEVILVLFNQLINKYKLKFIKIFVIIMGIGIGIHELGELGGRMDPFLVEMEKIDKIKKFFLKYLI